MSDKYTLGLKNFRSIREAEIDIAPLTVVYGPNGSGKSSLIYGLLTLKNFLTEPNRNLPSLFSYPGITLGGHDELVFTHQRDKTIEASLSICSDMGGSRFNLGIKSAGGTSSICLDGKYVGDRICLEIEIPFPYTLNQYDSKSGYIVLNRREDNSFTLTDPTQVLAVNFNWNGVFLTFTDDNNSPISNTAILSPLKNAIFPTYLARFTYFVPLRRGFMSPLYGVTNVTPMLSADAEVASLLATDRFLGYRVSDYMEMVADRQIHARAQIGTSSFTIDSVPRNRETPVSIVNEGFGVNQLAYMLTVALYDKAKLVLIEEPEIHLHPSMVRKLVHAFVDIVSNSDRRFVISTHSETFVVALLAQIAAGKIGVDDVSFILAEKQDGESEFTRQEAKPNGQIQGGLESFIASEFEDIAAFLGLESFDSLADTELVTCQMRDEFLPGYGAA